MTTTHSRTPLLGALIGAAASIHGAPVLFPNGDFENPGGDQWTEASEGAQAFNYPVSGGNGGGYAEIVSSEPGGFAVLVSNNEVPLPLEDLGLQAGRTYTFSYDMKASAAGADKGGIKVESWTGTDGISNSGDRRVSPATTDWETHTLEYSIAPGATHIKVVPLWTPNETVGFDNIGVDNTPLAVPPPPLLPNGDFETPGGSGWFQIQDNGSHSFAFPATGGNPGGHAVIDSVGATSWAALVANNNGAIRLDSLGLMAGETYTFTVDMKILEGSNIGGIAIDFAPGGTEDLIPVRIGDGSTWETYEFEITIPEEREFIIVKLVWGADSRVAYDNITFLTPPPASASIRKGTVVSWMADEFSSYQAQSSPDGENWTNVGPVYVGNGTTSTFDAERAAFYRALETSEPFIGNAVANPSFESVEAPVYPSPGATDWSILVAEDTDSADGTATMVVQSSYTNDDSTVYLPQDGNRMLVIESTTPAEGPVVPPNTDVRSANFFINPAAEAPYEISFHAINLYKAGGANPQYRFLYFGGDGGVIDDSTFVSFAGVGDSWVKVEATINPPVEATAMTIEFIQAMGAGNGWRWVTLIDNIVVPFIEEEGASDPIAATTAPGLEVSWNTQENRVYQVKSSEDLIDFKNLGDPVTGDGGTASLVDTFSGLSKYYQVEESAP